MQHQHKDKLKKYLEVNVEGDKEGVHPPLFCNKCWATLKKVEKATSSGTVSRTSLAQNPLISVDGAHGHMHHM